MNHLPKARTENVVVQDLSDELLIYNKTTNQAYSLNKTSKVVFNACDGATSFDELKRRHKFTDDLIHLALGELKMNNLLEDYESDHFKGLSRRELIKRVGLASLIALPLISSLAAPSAANAASGGAAARQDNGTTCTTARTTGSTECKSGRCRTTNVFNYNTVTGGTSFVSAGGLQCCTSGGGSTTGSYSNGTSSGICNLAATCCTGTGTENYDAPNNRYYCICAATS